MSYSVHLPASFKRSLKLLTRRFPHVRADVSVAIEEILYFPMLGAVIPGSGGVRKLRVRSTDLKRRELRALLADLKRELTSMAGFA